MPKDFERLASTFVTPDAEGRTVTDGLFAIADAVKYLADIIGECPLKDMTLDVCNAIGSLADAITNLEKDK